MKHCIASRAALLALVALAIAPLARADLSSGPESHSAANLGLSYYSSEQRTKMAVLAGGDFVVVHESKSYDPHASGVMAHVLSASGAFASPPIEVSGGPLDTWADVAATGDGGFVVVWYAYSDVLMRRFDSTGAPLGTEFVVNHYTTGAQGGGTSVASLADGGFVVVWGDRKQGYDILGRRFDSAATPVGAAFVVNAYTTSLQKNPVVQGTPDGGFVVVWEGHQYLPGDRFPEAFGPELFGQRYDAGGAPTGTEFQVNTYTSDDQRDATVAVGPDGGFIVAWMSEGRFHFDYGDEKVLARVYDAGGAATTTEDFLVNTYTGFFQNQPSAVALPGGGFVVGWRDYEQEGTDPRVFGFDTNMGIFAQRLQADGTPAGTEFHVNGFTAGEQEDPALAADALGLVAVWRSGPEFFEPKHLSARRICGDGEPDADGDGAGDGCDACTAAPGAQAFTAARVVLQSVITDDEWRDDRLVVKGRFALPAGSSFADLDPLSSAVRLVVLSGDGRDIVDQTVPTDAFDSATGFGWSGGDKLWRYRDDRGAYAGGTSLIKIRSTGDGRNLRFVVKSKDAHFRVEATDAPVTLTLAVGAASAGQCGEIRFDAEKCSVNARVDRLACRR